MPQETYTPSGDASPSPPGDVPGARESSRRLLPRTLGELSRLQQAASETPPPPLDDDDDDVRDALRARVTCSVYAADREAGRSQCLSAAFENSRRPRKALRVVAGVRREVDRAEPFGGPSRAPTCSRRGSPLRVPASLRSCSRQKQRGGLLSWTSARRGRCPRSRVRRVGGRRERWPQVVSGTAPRPRGSTSCRAETAPAEKRTRRVRRRRVPGRGRRARRRA